MDVTWWRGVGPGKRGLMYRPCCERCLDRPPGTVAVTDCDICGRPTGYAEPPPPGKGTWISWLTVCSLDCLNVGKAEREAPAPEPRRCVWCGHEFTPARNSTARTCSARCRKAKSRARPIAEDPEDVRAIFERLGLPVPEDGKLPPLLGDAVAEAINRLADDPQGLCT